MTTRLSQRVTAALCLSLALALTPPTPARAQASAYPMSQGRTFEQMYPGQDPRTVKVIPMYPNIHHWESLRQWTADRSIYIHVPPCCGQQPKPGQRLTTYFQPQAQPQPLGWQTPADLAHYRETVAREAATYSSQQAALSRWRVALWLAFLALLAAGVALIVRERRREQLVAKMAAHAFGRASGTGRPGP